jgi:Tol biopolymer transport system component
MLIIGRITDKLDFVEEPMKLFATGVLKPFLALLILILSLGSAFPLQAQERPLWLRYPAIAPDGQSILFCYKGDIYRVSSSGGQAIPLTISESYDFSPVWSHDGKFIAFASNRYGNFDIFMMPSSGGEATRLTCHSADDIPSSFTADDQRVLFTSTHQDLVTNVQFPVFPGLYSVSVNGGEAVLVLTQSAISATVNPTGDKIIYHDLKGYENDWRKHHTSSATRDIWVYDLKTKARTAIPYSTKTATIITI